MKKVQRERETRTRFKNRENARLQGNTSPHPKKNVFTGVCCAPVTVVGPLARARDAARFRPGAHLEAAQWRRWGKEEKEEEEKRLQ